MILGQAMQGPRASMEGQVLSWDEVQAWFKRIFLSGEEMEGTQANAEHLSPVAAAHRILTNSFGLIPFGAYRKDGDARIPYEDEYLRRMLKVRPNDHMSPFLMRKVVMSNAFWHGFGAVWNRRDDAGRVIQRLPLPTECCSILRDPDNGQYWYEYNVDGVVKRFSNYELSFLYDRLNKLRGMEDSDLQYLMESTVEPKFRDKAWYKEKMGCPTPIEAMKKLLREGEVRAILRKCDELNGYGYGAVVPLSPYEESIPEDELQGRAIGAALEDLEKN